MWTPTTRQQHSRTVTRYQTDLTDAEWRVITPHLPKPCATGRPDTDGHGATKSRAELTVLTCLTPVVLMRDQVVGEPWRGPLCQARSRW